MNGQLLCSGQKLSTTIHGGNVAVPWQFLGIHASTALVLPFTSMAKSNNVHDYRDVGGSAKQDARAEDERSAFMFRTKAKYHHPWRQWCGAMAVPRHPCLHCISASMHVVPRHPCLHFISASMHVDGIEQRIRLNDAAVVYVIPEVFYRGSNSPLLL